MRYAFIHQHRQAFSIQRMCAVLGVARSGYYAWRQRDAAPSSRRRQQAVLDQRVAEAYHHRKGRSSAPRLALDLRDDGLPVDRKTVAASLQRQSLRAKAARKFKATTNSRHTLPVAPNLLEQDFTATAPNQKWVGDITYLATGEGWLYLAVLIDLYSRKVVGWAMSERMTADLVGDALKMALWRRKMPKGVVVHSDRGSQILLDVVPVAADPAPSPVQHECQRQLLRQCLCRELLPQPQGRGDPWRTLRDPGGHAAAGVRVH